MKNIYTISKYTFIEVFRSKIVIGLGVLALFLMLICYVASEFAYGAPSKVALDFGLGIMSLSNMIIAIFIGSTLLSKEIENRNLYMILSRPISRTSFLLGKILGLSAILVTNAILLTIVTVIMFVYYGGVLNSIILWATYFTLLESFILIGFSVLFSLVTNVNMSVFYSLIILTLGYGLNDSLKGFVARTNLGLSKLLSVASFFIPNFEKLNLKDFVIYKQEIGLDYLISSNLYVVLYLAALFVIISLIFENKNLD